MDTANLQVKRGQKQKDYSSAHLNMNKVNHMFRSVGRSNSFNLSDSASLFVQHTTIVLLQSHDFNDRMYYSHFTTG